MSTTSRPEERPSERPQPSGSPFGKFLMSPVLVAVVMGLMVSAVALAAGGVFTVGGGSSHGTAEPTATQAPAPDAGPTQTQAPDAGSPSEPRPPAARQRRAYHDCRASISASCRPLLESGADARLYFACREQGASGVEACVRLATDPAAARAYRACLDAPTADSAECLRQARARRG